MENKITNAAHHPQMGAAMASAFSAKPAQPDLIQLHQATSWKRYESEEEEVSESSSQSFVSPTDGENEADSSDDSSSVYSQHSATKVTRSASPFYLSPVCYVPEGSTGFSREELVQDSDDEEMQEFEWQEVAEAKQVIFTAPTSKPSIVIIQSPTTDAILSARMGEPVNASHKQSNSIDRPARISKRLSTKRSLSASDFSHPDRPKRHSSRVHRDLDQGYRRSRPRSRVDPSSKPNSTSNHAGTPEQLRQLRPRRAPSQRSPYHQRALPQRYQRPSPQRYHRRTPSHQRIPSQGPLYHERSPSGQLPSERPSRSNQYTPDHDRSRNYSRPGSDRSASVASVRSTASSVSWKRVHSHNSSSASSQHSSQTSIDLSALSSSGAAAAAHHEADMTKPAPHPLSIITSVTSPTAFSAFDDNKLTPHPNSAVPSRNDPEWSPIDRAHANTATKTFPYSRSHNPSLMLSPAMPQDLNHSAPAYSRMRTDSGASSPAKSPISPSGSVSDVTQNQSSSSMKMLFRGRRTRQ